MEEINKNSTNGFLYRYLPAEFGLQALQTGRLKIGRISELNDPHDCMPYIENEKSYGALETSILQERHGVISFSTKDNDPVIWSHYADCHRGIALKFHSDFLPDITERIEYTNIRPSVKDNMINDEHYIKGNLTKSIIAKFCHKAESWEYEGEVRIFPSLSGKKMRGTHYFYEIPKQSLKAVILGANCSLNWFDIQNAVKGSRLGISKIPVFRCSKQRDSFLMGIDRA
ncbi:DUF2971 domain-containing protein [Coraliomargarita algicola]|uniref:DUF2971 domain-containing protein n=1 Tax=Coraliomargarita algicola TaxID=3092156 RepID=A0ABZ0RP30_9BACT|nr:DUF2971 domain-containing protein [Coraliomargarita sp. J2-16]WPJ96652.1 DUF2971 domain-containing protein [Coraliomargarita sp. J2-16]